MSISKQAESGKIRIALVRTEPMENDSIISVINKNIDMEFIGSAQGMQAAIELVHALNPDILLVESIPDLPAFTSTVRKMNTNIGILLLNDKNSSLGAQNVVDALAAGAFDVVPAIDSSPTASNLLLSRIRCCSIKQYSRLAKIGNKVTTVTTIEEPKVILKSYHPAIKVDSKYTAILIGVSTGGPEALMQLLPKIHATIPVPIVIVLHMPKQFTGAMAEALDRKCQIRVSEAIAGETIVAGRAYLAPGGHHCSLLCNPDHTLRIHLTDGPAENGCKPSVDVLFRSIPNAFGPKTLAVILTGMGNDGTDGAHALKHIGAHVLVQDEASSVVWGMPGSVVRAGVADEIIPLEKISARLHELTGRV